MQVSIFKLLFSVGWSRLVPESFAISRLQSMSVMHVLICSKIAYMLQLMLGL